MLKKKPDDATRFLNTIFQERKNARTQEQKNRSQSRYLCTLVTCSLVGGGFCYSCSRIRYAFASRRSKQGLLLDLGASRVSINLPPTPAALGTFPCNSPRGNPVCNILDSSSNGLVCNINSARSPPPLPSVLSSVI